MTKYLKQKDTILEFGLGSGFTANYLRNKNDILTTLDIDNEKKPEIVANIIDYELKANYDVIFYLLKFSNIFISTI